MLTDEQAQQMKSNIIQQIESTFPEDKKQVAIQQVEAMGIEELEQFIERNNAVQAPQNKGEEGSQCIFCLISSGSVPSYKIDGNKTSDAFLEINPISKGHIIIVPKKHSKKIQKRPVSFAEKISKKVKTKLKPKNVIISPGNLFGHGIVNIIPVYQDENEKSERYKAEDEELKEVHKILTKKTIRKPKLKKITEKIWLPKRIP